MWLALAAAAHAADVSTDAAGVVTAKAVVTSTVEQALALVRDPVAVQALSGDPGTLRATPDGSCFELAYARSSMIGEVSYTARGCPTASGFRTELAEGSSTSFDRLTSEWTVRPTPAGTELTYVYRADVRVALPAFLIRRTTAAAVSQMMDGVVARLGVTK